MTAPAKVKYRFVADRRKMDQRLERKQKKVLYKQGGFLRTTMQRSMRYTTKKNKHSLPGRPPLAHKGTRRGPLLRKLIAFWVDATEGVVTCGPPLTDAGQSVPKVLDRGGTVRKRRKASDYQAQAFEVGGPGPIRLNDDGAQWVRLDTVAQAVRAQRVYGDLLALKPVAAHIAPRPFRAPTFVKGEDNFAKLIESTPL